MLHTDPLTYASDLKDVVKSTAARSHHKQNMQYPSPPKSREQARTRYGNSRKLQKPADAAGNWEAVVWQWLAAG